MQGSVGWALQYPNPWTVGSEEQSSRDGSRVSETHEPESETIEPESLKKRQQWFHNRRVEAGSEMLVRRTEADGGEDSEDKVEAAHLQRLIPGNICVRPSGHSRVQHRTIKTII